MWFNDDDRASWAFVEGSISVSASILMANAIARCGGCGGWPVLGFFKRLTEQEDGVLIAGMALLFPTAIAFYLGVKMVFAAYRGYRSWREARLEQIEQMRAEAREKGHEEGIEEGQERGLEMGRELGLEEGKERGLELGREMGIAEGQERGLELGITAERDRVQRAFADRGIVLSPEAEKILAGEPEAQFPNDGDDAVGAG